MLYRCGYDDCSNYGIPREIVENGDQQPVSAAARVCSGYSTDGWLCGRLLDRLPDGPEAAAEQVASERPPQPEAEPPPSTPADPLMTALDTIDVSKLATPADVIAALKTALQ